MTNLPEPKHASFELITSVMMGDRQANGDAANSA
jgi:hypothetical protein